MARDFFNKMTPMEQAKLQDFVQKDMRSGANFAPTPASAQNPTDTAGADMATPVTNDIQTQEVTASLRQSRQEQSKKLGDVTPSVIDPDAAPLQVEAEHDNDIDVDMFARVDVGKVVDRLKIEAAEQERRELAKRANLPFARILGYPISPEVLTIVPRDLAKNNGVISYLKAGKKVRLGITNPNNKEALNRVQELRDATGFDFLVSVIGDDSYEYAIKLYDEIPAERAEASDVTVARESKKEFSEEIRNLVDLKNKIQNVPTTKLIDLLLTGAVSVGASDVHIEPVQDGVKIRYRLDGVLQDVVKLPPNVTNSIMSRLKFLAKLKLDVAKLPQDGRFTINDTYDNKPHELDIRVATVPVQYGEAITMRLLDRGNLSISIDSLGLTGEPLTKVLEAIKRPQGLVLESGPTGSGKTTTLYALLAMLNDPGKKIITLEDPVEYRMEGIMQSQIKPDEGYDFGEGFRSVLRLDPDIVMVGEIRDQLTAEMATQASLTGHIVLSTLHTNDAPTAIPRLIDLGVRPFLLSNAVNVVIAQRLVRKVCSECASEVKPEPEVISEVRARLKEEPKALDSLPPEKEWLYLLGSGCAKCNNTGYRGRIGIYEVLVPSDEIERLAIAHAPVSDITEAAKKDGMMTMEADGLIKALTGVTTIEEVWRVARDI